MQLRLEKSLESETRMKDEHVDPDDGGDDCWQKQQEYEQIGMENGDFLTHFLLHQILL